MAIHPTAVIAPGVQIGKDVHIGPYTVIEEDCIIGDNCWIDAHVKIGRWTTIGASASLRGGVKDWGTQYWVNGGWDHSDGYRHDSGFDAYYAGGGVKQNFDNGSYIRLSAFWSDVDSELPGYLSRDDRAYDPEFAE